MFFFVQNFFEILGHTRTVKVTTHVGVVYEPDEAEGAETRASRAKGFASDIVLSRPFLIESPTAAGVFRLASRLSEC